MREKYEINNANSSVSDRSSGWCFNCSREYVTEGIECSICNTRASLDAANPKPLIFNEVKQSYNKQSSPRRLDV